MENPKYPIIEVSGTRATLTPDGWMSEDKTLQDMLEVDRKLYRTGDYHPNPLNAEAKAEASRWMGSAQVIYLMPDPEGPAPDGIVY